MGFRLATLDGRAVLVKGDGVYDLERHSNGRFGSDPMAAIAGHENLGEIASSLGPTPDSPLDASALGLCVPRAGKTFGIGLNYRSHAAESGMEPPTTPVVFTKFPSSLIGPCDDIVLRGPTTDWEAELVVVIGSRVRDVPESDAWNVVAGLACGQDISERTMQFASKPPHFDLGKSYDTYGPIGPWIVSVDEFTDPSDLSLKCEVNGEPKQDARTSDLIFGIPQLIAYLSAVCTLEPGDLIFTGTPSGVGVMSGTFLQPGDTVTTTIEGIGTMTHRCAAAG